MNDSIETVQLVGRTVSGVIMCFALDPLLTVQWGDFPFLGSLVRPKVVRSVHYCPATKKTIERRYTDLTTLEAFPSSSVYPTKVREINWWGFFRG